VEDHNNNSFFQGVILSRYHSTISSCGQLFIILILSLSVTAFAETSISQIAIGGTANDGANNFLQVDGGLVFAGNTNSIGVGSLDALVFKTDSSGTPIWSTVFGGYNTESAIGLAQIRLGGGYVVTGRTDSHGFSGTDLFFARLDADGNITHFKTYGGSLEDRSMGLIPTQDGQFLIFGATKNGSLTSGTTQDVLLIKVTEFGDVIWSRAYGGAITEVAYSAKETAEGDIVVFAYGDSWENQQVSTDMYLIKVNKNGNLLWTTCYGGPGHEMLSATSAGYISQQGDIYVMGATNSYGSGGFDEILMKFNSMGTLQWTQIIGGSGYDYGRGVMQTNDDGILAWGFISDPQNGSRDGVVSKFTSDGVNLWSKVYGGTSDDDIYRIKELEGDSLLMMGLTESFGNGGKDIWLLYTDSEGTTDCNMSTFQPTVSPQSVPLTTTGAYRGTIHMEISDINLLSVATDQTSFLEADTICTSVGLRNFNDGLVPDSYYLSPNSPNPFNPGTTIHFELPEASKTNLSIFNVKGQWVQNLVLNEDLPAGSYTKEWDGKDHLGKDLPSGVYICRMQSGNFVQKQEMLLLK